MCADDDEIGGFPPRALDDNRCGGALADAAPRSKSSLPETFDLASKVGTRGILLLLDHGRYRRA